MYATRDIAVNDKAGCMYPYMFFVLAMLSDLKAYFLSIFVKDTALEIEEMWLNVRKQVC